MKNKKILLIISLVFLLASSILLWWTTFRLATSEYSPKLLIWELVFFSVAFIFLQFICSMVGRVGWLDLIGLIILLTSIPFAPKTLHIFAVLLSGALLVIGIRSICEDLRLNVKINLWKSFRVGKVMLILAFAIVLSSQYYANSANHQEHSLIPGLELGKVGSSVTLRILAAFNPQFRSMQDDSMTVDQFLLHSYDEQTLKGEGDLDVTEAINSIIANQSLTEDQQAIVRSELEQKLSETNRMVSDAQKQLALAQGRLQLSQMAGHVVLGDEKISKVFSGIIETKINNFFAPDSEMPERAQAFQVVVAAIFLLSVVSSASLLWWLWMLVTIGLFRLGVRLGMIKIGKVPVEMEIIE